MYIDILSIVLPLWLMGTYLIILLDMTECWFSDDEQKWSVATMWPIYLLKYICKAFYKAVFTGWRL
jgi:hypothetical protein